MAALDGNLEMLKSGADEAVRVAEQYNLGFWRAYARSFAYAEWVKLRARSDIRLGWVCCRFGSGQRAFPASRA